MSLTTTEIPWPNATIVCVLIVALAVVCCVYLCRPDRASFDDYWGDDDEGTPDATPE